MPTIRFNSSTGSDTTASGSAGAITANGTNASYSGNTVTLDGSPDLSGFDADEDVLWLQTSTGRQFFDLSGADNSAKTVTTVDAPAGTSSGLTWGIGGKRATFNNTQSRFAFSGLKDGWIIETETKQTISATLQCNFGGYTAAIRGSTEYIEIENTANSAHFSGSGGHAAAITFEKLKFTNSNGSKNNAFAIFGQLQDMRVRAFNCIIGDATKPMGGVCSTAGGILLEDCLIQYCVSTIGAVHRSSGNAQFDIVGCYFNGNVIDISHNGTVRITVRDSIFRGASTRSIDIASTIDIVNSTIHGSAGDGIRFSGTQAAYHIIATNCNFTGNGGYGINITSPISNAGDDYRYRVSYCNFGTGASANTSGAVNGLSLNDTNLTVDPQYTDAANGDFSVGVNLKAKGFPDATRMLGANQSATRSYIDIGAAQREEPTGGGGGNTYSRGRLVNAGA